MSLTITLLLLGLGSGAMISLSALGLVLMFRSSGVLNFATGGIGMACAYVFWDLTQRGWSAAAAGPAVVLLGAALGIISYVLVIVLPRDSSNIMRVIGTLGILVILQSAMQLRYGPNPLVVDDFLPSGSVSLGGEVAVPSSRILLVVIALVLTALLTVSYSRSRFGLATTAAAENERKLAALGWRIGIVGSVNWGIGGALAGLAGILLAPITGVAITNGTALTVTVLAAALIGSLRSFSMTLIGGMVIGMLQSLFVVRDFGVSGLSEAIPFVVIVGVIIVRGRGLPLRSFIGDRLPTVGTGRISIPLLLTAIVLALVAIGPVLNDNGTRAVTSSMLVAITLLSFTVLVGYAGQMSLAQVTLGAVSGLIAARLSSDWGWPFALALVVGVLGAIPVGLLVGLPSARARGANLAIATLGLAVAIQSLIFQNETISGGNFGIPLSMDGSFIVFGADFGSFFNADRYAWLVLGFLVILAVMVANLRRGVTGRHMIAVRGNERAASGLGINVVSTKLWAFALATAIAGVGGVLTAFRGSAALFDQISVLNNIVTIGYAIVGGVGGALGALFGSMLEPAGAGNEILGLIIGVGPVWMGVVGGVLLIFTIITSPDGIAIGAVEGHKHRTKARSDAKVQQWYTGQVAEQTKLANTASDMKADSTAGADTGSGAALSVDGITVRFGAVVAVHDVSITVAPGEVVGVIGANGAGKTTLIDSITGFVPAEGTIRLGDVDLSARPSHARARAGIGRSWQSLEIFEDLTVLENLRAASDRLRWWAPLADLVRPERAGPTLALRRAVSALDLEYALTQKPSELSTGQRKLVALARAIAAQPSILLLDEPCSGLDQDEREEVGKVIIMLAREMGMGVLLVEHDVHLVRRLCDRVVALDFGQTIASGEPEAVLSSEAVSAAFLGEVAESGSEAVGLATEIGIDSSTGAGRIAEEVS